MNFKFPGLFKLYLLLLFPGYFFFHVAHSEGYASYVGWFGIFIVFTILLTSAKTGLYVLSGKQKVNLSSAIISVPATAFFIYIIAATLINHAINTGSYITSDGMRWSLENIVLLIGLYTIGSRLSITTSRIFTLSLILCFMGFAFFTYLYYSPFNNTIWLPREVDPSTNTIASYQSLAGAVVYTTTLCVFIKSRLLKSLTLTLSLATLYFIGSRTEFFLILSIIPFYVYINYGFRPTLAIAIASIPAILIILLYFGVNARYASLISGGNERLLLLQSAIPGIIESPILGDYLGQVREYGTTAAYVHNALSVLQQYGIFAFMAYCYLTLMALFVGLKQVRVAKQNRQVEILIYASIVSTVGIIASKAIAWPYPALAWGLACVALKLTRKSKLSSIETAQN